MKRKLALLAILSSLSAVPAIAGEDTAIFAGGCFWCIESDFEKVAGVKDVISGYTGGATENPTYKNHSSAGHIEAVRITYDPEVVTYDRLLEIFWRSVDPVDAGGQFCDRGNSYTTAVFATSLEQKQQAEVSKAEIDKAGILPAKIATPIRTAEKFWPAEEYHQDYHSKNPVRYKYYRYRCGRDQRVKALWGNQAYTGIKQGES